MNVDTGQLVYIREGLTLEEALTGVGEVPGPEWVEVRGAEEQIRAMARKVELGNRELEARKARRAQQRESRRRNR